MILSSIVRQIKPYSQQLSLIENEQAARGSDRRDRLADAIAPWLPKFGQGGQDGK